MKPNFDLLRNRLRMKCIHAQFVHGHIQSSSITQNKPEPLVFEGTSV
jgi:hypothetical protein